MQDASWGALEDKIVGADITVQDAFGVNETLMNC